jgi:hypothetical protein
LVVIVPTDVVRVALDFNLQRRVSRHQCGHHCARHDFGSFVMRKTGNLKAVMDAMGHTSVRVAMNYQHPELEIVREAINSRHILGHTKPSERIHPQMLQYFTTSTITNHENTRANARPIANCYLLIAIC